MNKELTVTEKRDLALKKEHEDYVANLRKKQEQKFPANFNFIKVDYSDGENRGKLVYFNQGDTESTLIGNKMQVTILAKRHRYIHNMVGNDYLPKEEVTKTALFEEFVDEDVKIFLGDDVIKTVDHAANWRKEECPEAKYQQILFVLYNDKVYQLRVTGSSCSSLFKFQDDTANKLSFEFTTDIKVIEKKNGAVIYFPMEFSEGDKYDEKVYQEMISKSFEVDKTIELIDAPEKKPLTPAEIEEEIKNM